MDRFHGLMPRDEAEVIMTFRDPNGFRITIGAGPTGWAILWGDHSSTYHDVLDTTSNNFKMAYKIAVDAVGELKEN